MWTYAPTVMQNQNPMMAMNQQSMGMNNLYNMGNSYNTFMPQTFSQNYNTANIYNYNNFMPQQAVPSYNTTNIYNNFFGGMGQQMPMMQQPMPMMPQMGMPTMFQGQMIGGMGMPTIMQGQSIGMPSMMQGQYIGMPSMQPQMPQMGMLQLLAGLFQLMMGGIGQQEVVQEEVTIDDKVEVWGDPHYKYTDENGEVKTFDHHGEAGKTYNVFKGDNLQIDGTYAPHGNAPCVINKTTVTAGNDVLTLNRNGSEATLNGEKLENGATGTLKDGTKYTLNGKVLSVTPNDGTGTVNIKAAGSAMTIDPDGKFNNVSGIIGIANKEHRALTEEEANKFDVSDNYDEKGNLIQQQAATANTANTNQIPNYFLQWANPFN